LTLTRFGEKRSMKMMSMLNIWTQSGMTRRQVGVILYAFDPGKFTAKEVVSPEANLSNGGAPNVGQESERRVAQRHSPELRPATFLKDEKRSIKTMPMLNIWHVEYEGIYGKLLRGEMERFWECLSF
jgi:hypothetical protein